MRRISYWIERAILFFWNRLIHPRGKWWSTGYELGREVRDDQVTKWPIELPVHARLQHIVILGKTGTGKSSLIKHLIEQDIKNDRGFLVFDFHGELSSFVIGRIAEEERKHGQNLAPRTLLIEPGDEHYSFGLNILAGTATSYVRVAEIVSLLKERWHLDAFGGRTEELLRNSLLLLIENGMTLVELPALLTNKTFRLLLLKRCKLPEVSSYFRDRYSLLSERLESVFREAVLNKVTAFTADPHFRHIIGQQRSSVDFKRAMDEKFWLVANLDKSRLGEQAGTLGALLLTQVRAALFSREGRSIFTIYTDDVQNVINQSTDLELFFAEARKFGVSIVTANQFLAQYSTSARSALLSSGTQIVFGSSGSDADEITNAVAGSRSLAKRLRFLPQRRFYVKSGERRILEGAVPEVRQTSPHTKRLRYRVERLWLKERSAIEHDIQSRTPLVQKGGDEALEGWK